MKTRRRLIQFGFLALTLVGVYYMRGNAEAWCPFGGVETLYSYVASDNHSLICSLAITNLYILAAILLMTVLLRRVFCGYMCPLGTIGEWLQSAARRVGVRPLAVPHTLDRGLALLKYAVLAVILYFTWTIGELVFRGYDPCYALISRHGADITRWAYVISGGIVAASLLILIPFCRYLCPLAAVLNPFSWFGVMRVRRDAATCVNCSACARACPMAIPVDEVKVVTAARCISCLSCVEVCPTKTGGAVRWGPPGARGRSWSQWLLIGVMLACAGGAVAASYLFPLPSYITTIGGARPSQTAVADLRVYGLTCKGRAGQLVWYLERPDVYKVRGYLHIEAWPGPDPARVRITYDPAKTDVAALSDALTIPSDAAPTGDSGMDLGGGVSRPSPFRVEGYDALALP